ncbi:unnamed protein product [Bursaphelenchus okinawaensis]|uniref:Uncharacterized protein n=1 Tax=Bursaphelenchus okinawaensis TaxID=465554 RepID=A0A811LFA0_9BILA|nr:unnamed protein product [Bursaphelenchus okinawaensis]CAG9121210.1 unnamed protein product [Bursaphelenchus okinawaensis]
MNFGLGLSRIKPNINFRRKKRPYIPPEGDGHYNSVKNKTLAKTQDSQTEKTAQKSNKKQKKSSNRSSSSSPHTSSSRRRRKNKDKKTEVEVTQQSSPVVSECCEDKKIDEKHEQKTQELTNDSSKERPKEHSFTTDGPTKYANSLNSTLLKVGHYTGKNDKDVTQATQLTQAKTMHTQQKSSATKHPKTSTAEEA